MKTIALLGSTGSIGTNALKVIQSSPDKYRVKALGAGRNIPLLSKQIQEFSPSVVAVLDEDQVPDLRERLGPGSRVEIWSGPKGFTRLAAIEEVDTVISAMTGAAGLAPTFEAIRAGKQVALANKETLVMAGPLVMMEAEKRGVSLLPIDSEHSAILQSLQGHLREDIKRVILTASGGPFKNLSLQEMQRVNATQALRHPNWSMGPKITIDSATLINKGLEAIEARWLFRLGMDQIHIVVHPQSIIHSMVEYRDGSVMAQMAIPDMQIPISYALSYPRHEESRLPSLNLVEVGKLTFERPDLIRFPCLALALRAGQEGGTLPAVLNAANEVAVEFFLSGKIGFLDISHIIEATMDAHTSSPIGSLGDVMEADRWAREKALETLKRARA